MSIAANRLHEILTDVAEKQDFIQFEYKLSDGSNKGDNFFGEITRVQLSGKKSNGKNGELDLILKCGASSPQRRKEFRCHLLFEREIFYYDVVEPEFYNFQSEKGLGNDLFFSAYPECIQTVCDPTKEEYMLVLTNLRPQGFEMLPRDIPNQIENMRMIMRNLAKFHAISFAMKDQDPARFEKFKFIPDIIRDYFKWTSTKKMFDASYDRTIELLEDPEYLRICKDLKENVNKYLDEMYDEDKLNRFGVVNHGDCWNNNVLYHLREVNLDYRVYSFKTLTNRIFACFRIQMWLTKFDCWIGNSCSTHHQHWIYIIIFLYQLMRKFERMNI